MKLDWDPEIDTPATVAVVGGGPTGVEAALYARFLGYFVMLFDSVKVGDSLIGWGEHPFLGESEEAVRWHNAASSLGLAAIEAQSGVESIPDLDAPLTSRSYVEQYLLPLARTDLLYEAVQIHSPVISISRQGCYEDDSIPLERRAEQEFRLLIDSKKRGEFTQLADILLDCTGVAGGRRGLATGGGLAIGQRQFSEQMLVGKRDILGRERQVFSGKHSMLFGNDLAACANAIDLAQLASETPHTRLSWVIPKRIGSQETPLELPKSTAHAQILQAASGLQSGDTTGVVPIVSWGIEALHYHEAQWGIKLQFTEDETLDLTADVFVNCASPIDDWGHARSLLVDGATDTGLTREPHYYVLGQKQVGCDQALSFEQMQRQIREVFALIGGRQDLNLYSSVKRPGRK